MKIQASRKRNKYSRRTRSKLGLFAWLLPVLAVSLWLGYKQVEGYLVQPKAIFVLGGDPEREKFAAQFAHSYPDLPIWVSGGAPKEYVHEVFKKAGIDLDRLHLDYQAVDTVTNFTSLVEELEAQGIDSVYLITSDYHMLRSRVIGEIVFGSRGIVVKPLAIPTEQLHEPLEKAIRDGGRAILWVTTGYTGATLGRSLDSNDR